MFRLQGPTAVTATHATVHTNRTNPSMFPLDRYTYSTAMRHDSCRWPAAITSRKRGTTAVVPPTSQHPTISPLFIGLVVLPCIPRLQFFAACVSPTQVGALEKTQVVNSCRWCDTVYQVRRILPQSFSSG